MTGKFNNVNQWRLIIGFRFCARLDALGARIRAADPRNVLSRGYALITGADTVVRKSASAFAPGDELRVVFSDGELRASVFEIKTND